MRGWNVRRRGCIGDCWVGVRGVNFCLLSQTIRLFAFANFQIVCIRKLSGLIGLHWFDLLRKSNKGPTEIRTRITRFKVWGPNHWTIGPFSAKGRYRHQKFPTTEGRGNGTQPLAGFSFRYRELNPGLSLERAVC
jgi:hypothetical protein